MDNNIQNTNIDDSFNNFSTTGSASTVGSTYSDGVGASTYGNVGGVPERETWSAMAQNLYSDMTLLWDRQSMLIRTEMNEKIADIKTASVSLGVGSVLMVGGLFALIATAIICLNLVVPLWAAAVIVTALLFIAGGVMLMTAKKKLEADKLKPVHSIEAFGEISTTLKERLYEFKH